MSLQVRRTGARPGRRVRVRDHSPDRQQFLDDVLEGLQRRRKEIPSKYFYDARGSRLFEEICELEEYYPTRTEIAIMKRRAAEMADVLGPRCLLIEYGCGSGRKTKLLLDRLHEPAAYVPVDISRDALARFSAELEVEYPHLEVLPVVADYTAPVAIPVSARPPARRAVYYPGSTVGNFKKPAARRFLRRVARLVGAGGALLIGVDLKKERGVLETAYNDAAGVTAAFNLNLLHRANRELGADFRPERFRHTAIYNERQGRIEMHLISEAEQVVRVGGRKIPFRKGETIFTECSYKYSLEEFGALGRSAGLRVEKVWTDARRMFSVQYLTAD